MNAATPTVPWLRARGAAPTWHRPAGAWSAGKPTVAACGLAIVVDYAAVARAGAPRPTCPACAAAPQDAAA